MSLFSRENRLQLAMMWRDIKIMWHDSKIADHNFKRDKIIIAWEKKAGVELAKKSKKAK